MNIDEVIADAKAEEEVNKVLTEKPPRFMETWQSEEVAMPVYKVLEMAQSDKDFNRLLDVIIANFDLNYNKTDLVIRDTQPIVEAMKVLYPHLCEMILDDLREREEE